MSEPRDTNINPSQFLPPNGYQPIKIEPHGTPEPIDELDKTCAHCNSAATAYKADLVSKIEGLKRGDEPLQVFSNNKPFKISQGEAWDFALDSVISIINKEGK